jgi:hypothetical protein
MPCPTIRNCEVVTYSRHRDTLISVGVSSHHGIKYVTVCVNDPILGCEHLHSRQASALIILERLGRALQIAG